MSLDALMQVRGLGKQYRSSRAAPARWILRDLDLTVRRGEFVALVGPSGGGKTTLLNLLAQVDAADEGEIDFDAGVVSAAGRRALAPGCSCRVGYVTQEDNLLPWRTALQNVLFPLEVQRRLTLTSREQARALCGTLGLDGCDDHYPDELSGGMRKRVALARTLVYDPPVMLMDEPFSSLDAPTRQSLHDDLLRLWQRGGKTILLVTHDLTEALALAGRVLVLGGRPARIVGEHLVPGRGPGDGDGRAHALMALEATIRAELSL